MPSTAAGYLPNDTPAPGRLLLLGLQHVVTMFPATVLVALLCGFHVETVLFGAGVSTIVALLLSRRSIGTFIPLFYGSSFSYIAAYLGVAQAAGQKVQFGVPLPDETIAVLQTGIVATGVLNVLVGLLVQRVGKRAVDRVLPPIVTGSVACVIGFGLAKAALEMSITVVPGFWGIALFTLLVTVGASFLLQGRGFLGMIPILLGAAAGYLLTLVVAPERIDFAGVAAAPLLVPPHFTAPALSGPLLATALFSVAIMAIATIPESTAHLYQMSLYVDRLADEQGRERIHLERYVGFNLVCDGVGDVLHGLLGATAGTNYGENNSLMAITRNYSGPALMAAGAICIVLAFLGKLSAALATIPVFVSGGLALYLFGVIGMQGIALMQAKEVDLFDPLQLAIGATILTVGIGGNIGFEGGFLPIAVPGAFPNGLPAIATAAVLGIAMNLGFTLLAPARRAPG
ncbi:MAG TPA: solute carrier family 23 protein [Thermoanaerobaculia bacterium]|nr:solute carrier family 23 protein [Thermoanaerobaculia bacterium]